MGLTVKKYDEEQRIEYCWYDSSNLVYSELYDKKDELKELTVVFKGGRQYKYFDVNVQDALYFSRGGLNNSVGEEFNKRIVKKGYKFEKLENADLILLESKKQEILLEQELKRKELLKEQEHDKQQ